MGMKSVSVAEVLDTHPFTRYQAWISFLCALVVVREGFGMSIMGLAAPKITESLHVGSNALGIAIGVSQIGPLLGAIALGTLSDRIGHKRMLIFSGLVCGVFTIATAMATNVVQLGLWNFLAGIGVGGSVPNALAFGCEYAPVRLRASLTSVMWVGMPLGAVMSGLLAAFVLPHYGWQMLFCLAGITPLLIVVLIWLALPESLDFLVRQSTDKEGIRRVFSRIAPGLASDPAVEFYSAGKKIAGVPAKHLFLEGRALITLLLWILSFLTFYFNWVLLTWAPTFVRRSGGSIQQSSITFTLLNFGSVIATLTMGRLMDRFGTFRTLPVTCILAFLSMGAFGVLAHASVPALAAVAVVTGFFVFGANGGCMALATSAYPASIRGSGLGWIYAAGKVGSISAPVVGGFLLALNWSIGRICIVSGLTGLLMAIVVILVARQIENKGH
jgi:AAHS family 4-hydroxybenzoate transporter-like MFS transporter